LVVVRGSLKWRIRGYGYSGGKNEVGCLRAIPSYTLKVRVPTTSGVAVQWAVPLILQKAARDIKFQSAFYQRLDKFVRLNCRSVRCLLRALYHRAHLTMADVTGLVIGVAALWQSCIQVYEIVDSTRQHGMEFELLNVKFEVERVRLLCWGDAVGLADVQMEGGSPTPEGASGSNTTSLDVRLRREDVRSTVIRLLGCIQHVFENTDRLQDHYGLQAAVPIGLTVASQGQGHGQGPPPSQSQRILNGVFRRAYDNLRRMAGERQRTTPLTRRTVWAVRDRRKFDMLVNELRGFNDSLESLFPDAQMRAAEAMRAEIEGAVEVRELQLLQEATADEHRDLSECASLRLEALGATVSARTELLSVSRIQDEAASQATAENAGAEDDWEDADEETPLGDRQGEGQTAPAQAEPEVDEMTKRLREVELNVEKKSSGALTLSLIGPYSGLAHVSGHVYWDSHKRDSTFPSHWDYRGKGFVSTTHAAFGEIISMVVLC
jgi:hypothetical protein